MKSIVYDRETRDHAMYWNNQYIGSRRTRKEAEETLDRFVYEMLKRSPKMDYDDLPGDAPGEDDPETGPRE